jgi:hypothetical protein
MHLYLPALEANHSLSDPRKDVLVAVVVEAQSDFGIVLCYDIFCMVQDIFFQKNIDDVRYCKKRENNKSSND